MIKNYVEQIVEETLSHTLKLCPDICKCQKCINDIKCITLNNIKPKYFNDDMEGILLKLESLRIQYKTDILHQIIKSITIVSQNKRHDF